MPENALSKPDPCPCSKLYIARDDATMSITKRQMEENSWFFFSYKMSVMTLNASYCELILKRRKMRNTRRIRKATIPPGNTIGR